MKFATVIDIGANKGQFALFARRAFPDAEIISFEPIAAAADIYERVFANDDRCRLFRVAIGETQGHLEIYVTEKNDASSFLAPTEMQSAVFGTRVVRQERVPIGPLNLYLTDEEILQPALLKLDVQGYELQALKGCAQALNGIDCVYLEVSFAELYENQPLATEIICWLRDQGFSVAGTFNQQRARGIGLVQADMLFRRTRQPDSRELAT